ncbi:hypothetical protein [Actinomadura sp. 6N118]|uniref:hypothetical protein n=1 Tax=Actinomadura sp. 6N118 TaxID=3375151 RepID=UPI0037A483F1
MLALRLTSYASTQWSWTGPAYVTCDRTSEINPIRHPMVEQLAATDGSRSTLIVRERISGRATCAPEPRTVTPTDYDQIIVAASQWPADHVLVETAPGLPIRVTAGAARTTPLYLAHGQGVLRASR